MNISKFPVMSTNLFPATNSTAGGQLITEFNLKSRETVGTDPTVEYKIGPSYTHAMRDFKIGPQTDEFGNVVASSVLQIDAGRALVDGYFLESLAPIVIDLNELNTQILEANPSAQKLEGKLAVGLRAMYSTEAAMVGTIKVENDSTALYDGIQVVILPESQMKLPQDVPAEGSEPQVTAHLKLGSFRYSQHNIYDVQQNSEKVKIFTADRIKDIDQLLDSSYVTKTGVDPDKLYVLSGRANEENAGTPWCAANDSLMIWDADPTKFGSDLSRFRTVAADPARGATGFISDLDGGKIKFRVKHKQVDGSSPADQYAPVIFELPVADYDEGTPGTISKAYTDKIKEISKSFNKLYQIPNGTYLGYIESLDSIESLPKPKDNPNWEIGNYFIVGQDNTVGYSEPPVTMYLVQGGTVQSIEAVEDAKDAMLQNEIVVAKKDIADSKKTIADSAKEAVVAAAEVVQAALASRDKLRVLSDYARESQDYEYVEKLKTLLTAAYNTAISTQEYLNNAIKKLRSSSSSEDVDDYLTAAHTKLDALQSNDSVETGLKGITISGSTKAWDYLTDADEAIHGSSTGANKSLDAAMELLSSSSSEDVASGLADLISQLQNGGDMDSVIALIRRYLVDWDGEMTTVYDSAVAAYESALSEYEAKYIDYRIALMIYYNALVSLNGKLAYLIFSNPPEGIELGRKEVTTDPTTMSIEEVEEQWQIAQEGIICPYSGNVGKDYFTLVYHNPTSDEDTCFYYVVTQAGVKKLSDPIILTKQINLAEQNMVGGFYNVPDTATDNGYVYLDDTGHLRLVDYALLRSGVAAYQLGQDISIEAGLSTDELQIQVDDYINERIAFPNAYQTQNSKSPTVIHVTLSLTKEDTPKTLNLYNIDSRFDTCVYLHITGTADSKTTINITNCQKLRIDNAIGGDTENDSYPIINLYNCNLFYDVSILKKLTSWVTTLDEHNNLVSVKPTVSGLKLWYERYGLTEPNLVVDNMTVLDCDAPKTVEELDAWSEAHPNDIHYFYSLRSITFDDKANIIGCQMLIRNDSTTHSSEGKVIISSDFRLPQGSGLEYPNTCLTKPLKITGSFISMYVSGSTKHLTKSDFTAVSQYYDRNLDDSQMVGSIAILADTSWITSIPSNITINEEVPGWDNNTFHIFSGGIVT